MESRRKALHTECASSRADAERLCAAAGWTWRDDPGRPGGGDWQRWQSAPLMGQQAWQTAWQRAQLWSQTPTAETLYNGSLRIPYSINGTNYTGTVTLRGSLGKPKIQVPSSIVLSPVRVNSAHQPVCTSTMSPLSI